MTWGNTIRAAVSGLTALYPAVLSPLNGDDGDQAEMATGIGRLSTAIDSLRSVSWHANDLVVPGLLHLAYETVGANLWDRAEVATAGGTTLWPYWVTNGTSASNARLIVPILAPMLGAGCYLKGYQVTSEHNGTAHAAVPAVPFGLEVYEMAGNGVVTKLLDYPAANTSNVGQYESASTYGGTFSTGTRPLLASNKQLFAALYNESGANAQVGRRVHGLALVFSKDA